MATPALIADAHFNQSFKKRGSVHGLFLSQGVITHFLYDGLAFRAQNKIDEIFNRALPPDRANKNRGFG
jgi:hypothetical protein